MPKGALEKQPKTKASLLKTKGPTGRTGCHSLSELLELRPELLKQGSHVSKISHCSRDLLAITQALNLLIQCQAQARV